MALDNLRILRLQAENVKKIKAVEITPTGEVVVVGGRNGQGKTSVLDSILWALGGEKPIQWEPIRAGEAKALIVLDLGDDAGLKLQVTRRFTKQEDGTFTTSLKVTNEDGFRPDGEQTLLNTIVGALSFDPGAFIRAKAADQVKILKGLIPGADFDGIAARRKKAFDERAEINREEKRVRASGEAIPVQTDLPDPVDVETLADNLARLGEQAQEREQELTRRSRLRERANAHFDSRDALRAEAEALRDKAAEADRRADEMNREGAKLESEYKDLPELPPLTDAADLRDQLSKGQQINRRHDEQTQRASLIAEADEKAKLAEAKTAEIEALDKEVLDLVASADLPVSGLALQNDMVYLRGVPFEQASDAEQLRAALAMGIAANPRLRVIRIRDGSLLDADALQVIREVAAEENFQIWMERVGTGSDPEEIVMEDGSVKE